MNKQQLASTICQSANQMRSKIEANEYKDYILGFMFYKYLSESSICTCSRCGDIYRRITHFLYYFVSNFNYLYKFVCVCVVLINL